MQNILVINALNGSIPLVLQNKYPSAKITCAEVFPFFKQHLTKLGFEVTDWGSVGDMKFDLVIGNPPYQDTTKTEKGGTTLWSQFIQQATTLVNPAGHLVMVTPNAWMSFGKSGKPLKGKQMLQVWTDTSRHFPGVGSTFSSWIMENLPTYKDTHFLPENIHLDLRNYESLPVGRPIAGIDIVEKIKNWEGPKIDPQIETQLKVSYSERTDSYSGPANATQTKIFKYKVFHTNSKTYFCSQQPTDYEAKKVIVSTSSPKPTYYADPMGCATGDLRSYILVDTDQQGENLVALLETKLYRFVWKKPGMISYKSLRLPLLDLRKKWTDTELYEYFDLSLDQICIVENWT